jgi:hypothetical protein
MRALLAFSGLELATYCVMDSHFHLHLRVPKRPVDLESMSDEAFLKRLHLQQQGQLSQAVLATTRMRYFADGLAIGTQSFLEEVFKSNRGVSAPRGFGPNRRSGARPMKGVHWAGLMNLRDLRKEVH